jgi:hypothetical protein
MAAIQELPSYPRIQRICESWPRFSGQPEERFAQQRHGVPSEKVGDNILQDVFAGVYANVKTPQRCLDLEIP